MNLRNALLKALRLPPHVTAKKVWGKFRGLLQARWERRQLVLYPSFHLGTLPGPKLHALPLTPSVQALHSSAPIIREACERIFRHEFDLLGSGPVKVGLGLEYAGFEGRHFPAGPRVPVDAEGRWLDRRLSEPNRPEARRRWSLVHLGYDPLDWQVDLRSGYRWTEAVPSRLIRYGREEGSDVKVPWEMGRMQHLPQLAYGYLLAGKGEPGFRPMVEYLNEFRNQVLDFTAQNPPKWGAQWACTMDVAIRVAGWVAAYGLFKNAGAEFDPGFEEVFLRSLVEHRDFILTHLEWDPHLRANHYLADVTGLLFVAGCLPPDAATDAALAYAVQETVEETRRQFHPDGSNFEASTSYHRLSAEMVAWGTALVLGLPEEKSRAMVQFDASRVRQGSGLKGAPLHLFSLPGGGGMSPFPEDHFKRLEGMGGLIESLSHPDGHMPQFGDNDSGRFLVMEPGGKATLDHRGLVSALNGFFGRSEWRAFAGEGRLEEELVRGLAGGKRNFRSDQGPVGTPGLGMGAHKLSGPRIHVVLRCGEAGQSGNGGHAHADPACFELSVDGARIVVDPGTFVYTALPNERNAFRSSESHNAFRLAEREPVRWAPGPEGLFSLQHWPETGVVRDGAKRLAARYGGYGAPAHRVVTLEGPRFAGEDHLPVAGPKELRFHFHPAVALRPGQGPGDWWIEHPKGLVHFVSTQVGWSIEDGRYSPGYGQVEMNQVLVLRTDSQQVEWTFLAEGRP